MGTEIGTLFWIVNGTTVATYGFRDSHTFPYPLPITPRVDGVTAMVISASINPNDDFDVTSVLRVGYISILNGTSLQCQESVQRSEIITIEVDNPLSKFDIIVGIRSSYSKL